jgi:spore coat polysaccharide biosynthesis protein SpsF
MEALNRVPAELRILACPEDCLADFGPLALEAGFEITGGPKDDVLARYCLAVRRFGIRGLIRATGDNPFVFADAASAISAEARALGASYAAYAGLPLGAGVEAVDAASLSRAGDEARSSYEREHVCPYLYGHPELFSLHRPLAPLRWQDPFFGSGPALRLTIDTAEDYERAKTLYRALSEHYPGEERFLGPAIIKTYNAVFSGGETK